MSRSKPNKGTARQQQVEQELRDQKFRERLRLRSLGDYSLDRACLEIFMKEVTWLNSSLDCFSQKEINRRRRKLYDDFNFVFVGLRGMPEFQVAYDLVLEYSRTPI